MNESKWLTSIEPALMLDALPPFAFYGGELDRKLTLWAEAAGCPECDRLADDFDAARRAEYVAHAACRTRAEKAAVLREVFGNPFRRLPTRSGDCLYTLNPVEFVARITPTVLSLAWAAYDERLGGGALDSVRLAILADALGEEGCEEESILRHLRGYVPCVFCGGRPKSVPGGERTPCMMPGPKNVNCREVGGWHRSPGPHVRGCWALDLILGRG